MRVPEREAPVAFAVAVNVTVAPPRVLPSTAADGDVAKFIEKRGEGVMLISFNVDNTRQAMDELQGKGYPFIGGARPFRDCEFAFVHPKKMNGVLLELIDYKWREFEKK